MYIYIHVYQHTAAHCNTLQHTAMVLRVLWWVVLTVSNSLPPCNTLQHTATHCNTLQHIATPCNTLQHTAHCSALHRAATHYNTLQHSTTLCNTRVLTAPSPLPHTNTLQPTAPRCNTLHRQWARGTRDRNIKDNKIRQYTHTLLYTHL